MAPLVIQVLRAGLVESAHRVAVAVTDAQGHLRASAGEPGAVTFWRSGAKPFQALPLVEDGVLERFGFGMRELALACASHSSDPVHVQLARYMLERIGCSPADLACGPHQPLSGRHVDDPQPVESNCSGKHAAMLALARHHGWPTRGYERAEHPVQARILEAIVRETGLARDRIETGVDGCTVVCFALPLFSMARAYARLAAGAEPALAQVRDAMRRHPELVAGPDRPCTQIMEETKGAVLAKVGADGVYSAAVLPLGLGITVKAESGDGRAATVALLFVLSRLASRSCPELLAPLSRPALSALACPRILNTRGIETGTVRVSGELSFHAAS